jgi:hypothetical protein
VTVTCTSSKAQRRTERRAAARRRVWRERETYRTALVELVQLVLDEMPAATNRDLACDGPVGNDDEATVWRRIDAKAREIRELLA